MNNEDVDVARVIAELKIEFSGLTYLGQKVVVVLLLYILCDFGTGRLHVGN